MTKTWINKMTRKASPRAGQKLWKDGKMVIPKSLQHYAVAWFHHYLQHPGAKHFKETLYLSMYWIALGMTVQLHVKMCRSCQMNKCRQHKHGKLPTILAITNPWEALCVDLIGPYMLKGKDKTKIDLCTSKWSTHKKAGLRLLSCQYNSYLSLIFPWVQRGERARTNTFRQNNPTLTRCQLCKNFNEQDLV